MNSIVSTILTFTIALAFLRLMDYFAHQGWIESRLSRQPARVAVTASASMIGLAVIVAAGRLVSSMTGTLYDMIQDNPGSDYLFIPPSIGLWGSNLGAGPAFAESLRQVQGVEAVSTFRFTAQKMYSSN